MSRFCLVFTFVLIAGTCYSQSKNLAAEALYQASTIPDSLKVGANAVVRYSEDYIVLKAPGKGEIRHRSIVTLLNEKAETESVFYLNYDKKYNTIEDAEMLVYDPAGKLIKKYKKSDMYDGAASDGFSLVTDDRFKAVKHTVSSYPVTIEIIYQRNINSMLDLPDWQIQRKEIAVENSLYSVAGGKDVGLRYKCKNINLEPQKSNDEGMEVYSWKVKNLKAIKIEEGALEWKILPRISFSCDKFEFYGVPGTLKSWQSFGQWLAELNTDVCDLSLQRQEEIRNMVSNLASDKEKIKFLYEYMQKNVRYVSIQLGIGGLKPFPATFVDSKKYGDCKALSNYMKALLKAVNIPSYCAIIRAGENEEPADPDFSNDPFNHVILCVPGKTDSTWLECTSSFSPAGKLGPFTENRNALLITETGGKLVNTPISRKEDNVFESNTMVSLDAEGGAHATLKIKACGEYRKIYKGLSLVKTDEQKAYLIKNLQFKQPDLFRLQYGDDKNGSQEVNIDLDYYKFSDMAAGDKYFFRPQLLNICNFTLPELEKRGTDFYFDHPLAKLNTVVFEIPEGYEVESLPANQNLKCGFGNYEAAFTYNKANNKLTGIYKLDINTHIIPASRYQEMQKFISEVSKSFNKKFVMRKKTGR